MTGNGTEAQPWYWGHHLETAERIAAEANVKLGLTRKDVLDIVLSSMVAGRAR